MKHHIRIQDTEVLARGTFEGDIVIAGKAQRPRRPQHDERVPAICRTSGRSWRRLSVIRSWMRPTGSCSARLSSRGPQLQPIPMADDRDRG